MKNIISLILVLISLAGITQNKVRSDMWIFHDSDTLKFLLSEKTDTNVIYSNEVLMFDVDRVVVDTIKADYYEGVSTVSFGAENQIPSVNAATNDFDYDDDLTFDGDNLTLGGDLLFQNDAAHDVGSATEKVDSIYVETIEFGETTGANTGIHWGNTKIYQDSDNNLYFITNNLSRFYLTAGGDFRAISNEGAMIRSNFASSATRATLIPSAGGNKGGIGGLINQYVSIVENNIEIMRLSEDGIVFNRDFIPGTDGIYNIGSNTADIDTAFIDHGIFNTDVGIGTDDPNNTMSFGGTEANIGMNTDDGVDNAVFRLIGGGNKTITRGAMLELYGNEATSREGDIRIIAGNSGITGHGEIFLLTGGGNVRMRISKDGNVGIGTGTPDDKLDVDGSIHASDTVYAPVFTNKSDMVISESGSDVTFNADSTKHNIITATGGTSTEWNLGYDHISANGSSHSYIDQSVVSGATPTFSADNFSDGGTNAIITTTQETNFTAGYNDKINSAAFNTSDGIITLTQQDAGTVTVDIDGRYLELGGGTMTGNILQSADISIGSNSYDITFDNDSTDIVNYLHVGNIAIDSITSNLIPDIDSAYDIGVFLGSPNIKNDEAGSVSDVVNANDWGSMPFTSAEPINIKEISLVMLNSGGVGTGNIKLRIEPTSADAPINGGSTNLGESENIDISNIGTSFESTLFTFNKIVNLQSNTTYVIIIDGTGVTSNSATFRISADGGDGHNVYTSSNAGSTWFVGAGTNALIYDINPNYDDTKRYKNLYLAGDAVIGGDLTVTGVINHAGGICYVSTPGTQTIGTAGQFERLNEGAIAYTAGELVDFTHDDGRLTYTGTTTKHFIIHATIAIQSGESGGQAVNLRVAKGSSDIAGSNMPITFTAQTVDRSTPLLWVTSLATNEYIEIYGTSNTNADEFDVLTIVLSVSEH